MAELAWRGGRARARTWAARRRGEGVWRGVGPASSPAEIDAEIEAEIEAEIDADGGEVSGGVAEEFVRDRTTCRPCVCAVTGSPVRGCAPRRAR